MGGKAERGKKTKPKDKKGKASTKSGSASAKPAKATKPAKTPSGASGVVYTSALREMLAKRLGKA
jgi:hypothetical protein